MKNRKHCSRCGRGARLFHICIRCLMTAAIGMVLSLFRVHPEVQAREELLPTAPMKSVARTALPEPLQFGSIDLTIGIDSRNMIRTAHGFPSSAIFYAGNTQPSHPFREMPIEDGLGFVRDSVTSVSGGTSYWISQNPEQDGGRAFDDYRWNVLPRAARVDPWAGASYIPQVTARVFRPIIRVAKRSDC